MTAPSHLGLRQYGRKEHDAVIDAARMADGIADVRDELSVTD